MIPTGRPVSDNSPALPSRASRLGALLLVLVSMGAEDPEIVAIDPDALQAALKNPPKPLDAQTFWDNRDWLWYKANIPFFDCPDPAINTTYYYRWELLTKHLTYGSPATGYVFTEFIDRPPWSGAYGAISCPAGHQLYEARWLKDPRIARDYARYWFRTPGAQPRRYSTWLADAIWAVHQVHPDDRFITGLLPDLKRNYEAWERERFVPEVGLFWQPGHDDGMEYNINSRQTQDILRGAPAFRPTLNSYLWADALAIARIAELAGEKETARAYQAKAQGLKENLQRQLWDPKRRFFFPKALRDEQRDGFTVRAGSLTYQTGRFAGNPHGRELIGYVPWQFGLPDPGFESAWSFLMDPEFFFAPFGPTVTERHDPLFLVTDQCCWWSGQSWPYATTQTLKGLARLLQEGDPHGVIGKADYFKLLSVYTKTHRKEGRPYIAEAANPDTGSWKGYDTPNHSEHYFHSGYIDLIITGLVGLRPRDDDVLEVRPLAPDDWDSFSLTGVAYRGREVGVIWDRDGRRSGLGPGLHLLANGREIASSERLGPLTAPLPPARDPETPKEADPVNFAVNNDGLYYPRATASFTAPGTSVAKAVDGGAWYHVSPPNRWTCAGSPHESDWFAIDFGTPRRVRVVTLKLLDDGEGIVAPQRIDIETWDGSAWVPIRVVRIPTEPIGHQRNAFRFTDREITKIRAVFHHRPGARSGLTEFEVWGDGSQSIAPAPPPTGNLAYSPGDRPFPKVSASFTSRFDRVEEVNDGRVNFAPEPRNRWTTFGSPNASDWLAIDFGAERTVARAELAIYDDRGGVRAPAGYRIEFWSDGGWRPVGHPRPEPEQPAGSQYNEVRFDPVRTSKVRVVLDHRGEARSGLSEILLWPE